MFDLKKEPKEPFAFDLEADIKKDPKLGKKYLKEVDATIGELKKLLREGAESDDFDDYGVLLHGYHALQKILKKITAK